MRQNARTPGGRIFHCESLCRQARSGQSGSAPLPPRPANFISLSSLRLSPLAGPLPPGHTGARMSMNHVTLDDKYDLAKSRVFVTGYQALVRLAMMQHE